MPKQILPKSIARPSLLAHIAVSKYDDHLPLYRQEEILQRYDIDIARNTLSDWMIRVGDALTLMIKLFHHEIIDYNVAFANETPLQVLIQPNKTAKQKSSMWVFSGGAPEKRCVIYHYDSSRGSSVPIRFFEDFSEYIPEILRNAMFMTQEFFLRFDDLNAANGYSIGKFQSSNLGKKRKSETSILEYLGYIHADRYAGYLPLLTGGKIKIVACLAHIRRKFFAITQSVKTEGLAHEAMTFMTKLYAIEKALHERSETAETIKSIRAEQSKPLMDEMYDWLTRHVNKVPRKMPIGDAIHYAIKQWPHLMNYLEDGRLEIDKIEVSERLNLLSLAEKIGFLLATITVLLLALIFLVSLKPPKYMALTLIIICIMFLQTCLRLKPLSN
jgi:transposase